MSSNPVRWAILGAGKIAHKFAQDLQGVSGAQLTTVAARDPQRALDFARRYGAAEGCSYEALYRRNDVDAVYIATTHNFHHEQAMACLHSGKAVLCEKPVTINDTQFKELAALAKEKGLFFMEAMWMYFLPAVQQAATWLHEGRIGALQTIHAHFCYPMPYDPESRLYHPALAGGALLDLGIYPVALATLVMQRKPDTVKAMAVMTNTGVDEATSMLFKYGDVTAFLYASLAGRCTNKSVLTGDGGSIEIPEFFKARQALLFDANGTLQDQFDDDRSSWGYHYEIQEATDCILRGDTESTVVPHYRSNELQELLTGIRAQIGLRYPGE